MKEVQQDTHVNLETSQFQLSSVIALLDNRSAIILMFSLFLFVFISDTWSIQFWSPSLQDIEIRELKKFSELLKGTYNGKIEVIVLRMVLSLLLLFFVIVCGCTFIYIRFIIINQRYCNYDSSAEDYLLWTNDVSSNKIQIQSWFLHNNFQMGSNFNWDGNFGRLSIISVCICLQFLLLFFVLQDS